MASTLSGPRKAAILLLSLGEDAAAEVLKNLDDDEIKDVSRHMAKLETISTEEVDRVANEFYHVAERARFLPTSPDTRIAYLKRLLGRALGPERGEELVNGLLAAKPESPLEQLRWHSPEAIAEFLADENPQIIAVILTRLGEPDLVEQVLRELPAATAQEVRARMVRVRSIPEEWLADIENLLNEEMLQPKLQAAPPTAQAKVANVLTAAPAPLEEALVRYISRQDPELAEAIRLRKFVFSNFLSVDGYGIQLLLRRTPMEDLVLALKLADTPLREHFYRNMSKESAQLVRNALEALGPTAVGQIEAAQKRMATTARNLQNTGELMVLKRRSGEEAREE